MSEILSEWKLSSIKQQFLLPEAFVFYIAKNPPSPEVYNKLIRCCKYFWVKNPVITLNSLRRFCNEECWRTFNINGCEKLQKFNIETLNEKLWIHRSLNVGDGHKSMASSLIPKIYRCNLTSLDLSNQNLSFDEFIKFTSSGSLEILYINETIVKNDDGSIVPIEILIEHLPNLQAFHYYNVSGNEGLQTITTETAANLIAIPHFHQIKNFTVDQIPESFNFEVFFATSKVRTSMFT